MSDKKEEGITPGDENLDQFFGVENDPENEIPVSEEKLDLPDTTPRQHAEHTAAQAKKKELKGLAKFLDGKPPAVKYGLAGGLVLVMVVVLGWQMGFFGGEEEPSQRVRKPRSGKKPAERVEAETVEAAEPEEGAEDENSDEEPEEDEPEEIPPLAGDFLQWSEADYYRAKEENHPQLLAAIGHLGEDFVGSAGVARGLTNLLKPPAPKEEEETTNPPTSRRRPTSRRASSKAKVIEPILAALAQNDTDASRATLQQVLTGALQTEDDKTAVLGALQALADHPSPENDAVLFHVLTRPETVRDADEETVGPAELHAEAVSLVEESASPELRVQLAEYLLEPTAVQATRDALVELLADARPENVAAQIVLYSSVDFDDEAKQAFESYFATYSSRALAESLGIKSEAAATSGSRRPTFSSSRRPSSAAAAEPTDPELNYRLAQQLWSPVFGNVVAGSLAKAESLNDRGSLVELASTIPTSATRAALCEALFRVQEEIPKGGSGRSSQQLVRDPGYLLVVKRFLDRLHKTTARSRDLAEKQNKVIQSWQDFTGDLLRAQCDRFQGTAQARAEAARVAGQGVAALKFPLPLTLHPDAKPTATYEIVWPGATAAKLPGVVPGKMLIQYVRVDEEEADWNRILSIYKRNSRVRDVVELGRSHWLESCRAVTDTDRWRSIDVLLTPGENVSKPEEETGPIDLTIEVLVIEMKDPQVP